MYQRARSIWTGTVRLLSSRTLLILGIAAGLSVAGLVWAMHRLQTTLIQASALQSVSHYSQALQEFRTLYTSEVVERVRPQGLEVTHDYRARPGAIPLPVTLSMLLGSRMAAQSSGGQFLLYSPYPFPWAHQSGGLRDEFARDAWRALTQHPTQAFYRFEPYGDRQSLRYATADRMRPECVNCHNSHPDTPKNDWQEGDVRGVLELVLPLDQAVTQASASLRVLSLLTVTVTVLGLSCFGFVFSRIRRASQEAGAIATATHQANADLQREIAERRRVEQALRASEVRFRSVVESANDAIILADGSGNIISWNHGARVVFGYADDDVLGQQLTLLMPARYRDAHRQGLERLRATGEAHVIGTTVALHGLRKDGREFPLELSLSTWSTEGGVFFGGIIRDITERRRAEAELQQAKQAADQARQEAEYASLAKSQFLANMSHELRTPLNALLGYTQILQRDPHLSAPQRRSLEIMYSSGDHLLTLINDILDLSKIEAGRMELELSDFALREMLHNLATLFRERAVRKGLAFVYREDTAVPAWVHGDATKLRQVLLNLLSNAVKFTDAGTVTLHVGSDDDTLRFSVEDTGVGIAPAHMDTIFEAFRQVGPQGRLIEGTGLGLAISRTLTTIMGGELRVKSQAGLGSTFSFALDLPAVAPLSHGLQADTRPVLGFVGAPVKVLVVEDQWENRSVLVNMLAPLGFEVTEAVNGHEGVEKALALRPDVIFMDLKMPEMDGIEAIRRIRALPFGHQVVIIAISASAFAYNRQDSLEAGSDDFLAKPFRLPTLLELLTRHVHVEWTYAPATDHPATMVAPAQAVSPAPAAAGSQASGAPPVEDLRALLELARRGNLGAIRERVHILEQRDARHTPFAEQVRHLAQAFKINAMEEFFAQVLREAAG